MTGGREEPGPLLDFIRFGAALLVMLNHLRLQYFHSYSETRAASPLFKAVFFFVTRLGLESVVVFFVLSGFLVGGISVDKFLRGRFSPVKYAIDRLTRIYTPLVPVLLFALALCVIWGDSFSWGNFFVNLFSLQGVFGDPFPTVGALWSLSYEVWFYILCGALLCVVRPGSRGLKLILLLAVFVTGFVFSRLIATYLFAWMAGAAAYFIGRPSRPWVFFPAASAITVFGVFLMQVTSRTSQADFSRFRWIDHSTAILVLSLGLALLIPAAAAVRFTSTRGRRLAKAGSFLAGFSYSLYLIHLPMEQLFLNLHLLHEHDALDAVNLAGYLGMAVAMLAAAWCFYFCFERRTPEMRAWLHRLAGGPATST